jgi:hypothetical protein
MKGADFAVPLGDVALDVGFAHIHELALGEHVLAINPGVRHTMIDKTRRDQLPPVTPHH